ncbi:PEP-CTERM sorting domain-containing protein [Niveibacterium sp.]|uniref:PEP-CTERM sorting domain-containing protein n=1 Tax=Niveibacterium sp. TaxID=2017444 RepID=UPI0035B0B114
MKNTLKYLAAAVAALAAMTAQAEVRYDFDFTNMVGYEGGTVSDFHLTLTFPHFVTTTGMSALSGAPISTPLGITVAYVGTSKIGWWGFDDDTNSTITDNSFTFGGNSFLFSINDNPKYDYLRTPGVYTGNVGGNAPIFNSKSFNGLATLTITEVPEPETYALMLAGLGTLAGVTVARRRVNVSR